MGTARGNSPVEQRPSRRAPSLARATTPGNHRPITTSSRLDHALSRQNSLCGTSHPRTQRRGSPGGGGAPTEPGSSGSVRPGPRRHPASPNGRRRQDCSPRPRRARLPTVPRTRRNPPMRRIDGTGSRPGNGPGGRSDSAHGQAVRPPAPGRNPHTGPVRGWGHQRRTPARATRKPRPDGVSRRQPRHRETGEHLCDSPAQKVRTTPDHQRTRPARRIRSARPATRSPAETTRQPLPGTPPQGTGTPPAGMSWLRAHRWRSHRGAAARRWPTPPTAPGPNTAR